MVNPIAFQNLPAVLTSTPTETPVSATQQPLAQPVQPSAESQSNSQNYQRWPHRPPMGDLIEPEKSSLDTALEQLNQNMQAWATGVRFDIDPDTQRIVVSLVNNESGDVIRAVPSEAVLQISKMIAKFQGNTINTKA